MIVVKEATQLKKDAKRTPVQFYSPWISIVLEVASIDKCRTSLTLQSLLTDPLVGPSYGLLAWEHPFFSLYKV